MPAPIIRIVTLHRCSPLVFSYQLKVEGLGKVFHTVFHGWDAP
jgi:hypothetical protein